jgi:hypothetical protein
MPRTISTKPDYSVRWWRHHGYEPPEREVFSILRGEIDYRFLTPPPKGTGEVLQGDVRTASLLFPALAGQVKLVITSPPYLDTTHFTEDQWLRLWFLGGEERPKRIPYSDDRHTSVTNYWRFLQESWAGIRGLLSPDAHLIIRIGGAKIGLEEITEGLLRSMQEGLDNSLSVFGRKKSEISGGQVRSFQTKVKGPRFEYDFHYQLG